MRKLPLICMTFLSYHFAFSQWSQNGTNVYYNNGNVGIGTSTPADQVEIIKTNRKVGLNTAISGITNGGVLSLSRVSDGLKAFYLGTSAAPTEDLVIYGLGGSTEMRFVSGGGVSNGFGFYTNISSAAAFSSTRPSPVINICQMCLQQTR